MKFISTLILGVFTLNSLAQQNIMNDENYSSMFMADGKEWMSENLRLNISGSFCYEDLDQNCIRYGRLYTWESARRSCDSLGNNWRLPTDDEWRQMAMHYGGIFDDSPNKGRTAYETLLSGGSSGFNAILSGGRAEDGIYDDLDAHGFYWTASEDAGNSSIFYNFGKGSQALYRQKEGERLMAMAVRCIRE